MTRMIPGRVQGIWGLAISLSVFIAVTIVPSAGDRLDSAMNCRLR